MAEEEALDGADGQGGYGGEGVREEDVEVAGQVGLEVAEHWDLVFLPLLAELKKHLEAEGGRAGEVDEVRRPVEGAGAECR